MKLRTAMIVTIIQKKKTNVKKKDKNFDMNDNAKCMKKN